MTQEKIAINRPLVGILALCCLASAMTIYVMFPEDESWNLWQGGFTRVGLVMSAFWLALPSRHREAAWANVSLGTLVGGLLALIALVRAPIKVVLPLAVLLAVVGFFLRPRGKQRPSRRP